MSKAIQRRFLVIILTAALYAACLFHASPAVVADSNLYEDKNGYFSLRPPRGWKMEEFLWGYKSEAKFKSPDDAVTIAVTAELDNDDLGSLSLHKRAYVEDHHLRFPGHRFTLLKTTIAGFKALKIEFEVPQAIREDFYYFFFDGVRFDLAYSAATREDFEKYKDTAEEAFSTIRPKHRLAGK